MVKEKLHKSLGLEKGRKDLPNSKHEAVTLHHFQAAPLRNLLQQMRQRQAQYSGREAKSNGGGVLATGQVKL